MHEIRRAFLEAVEAAGGLLRAPETAARFDDDSVLPRMRVRGLAGHLLRATTSTEAYLDRPEPTGATPLPAAAYYADALSDPDLDSAVHAGVRARGEEAAAGGPAAVAAEWDAAAGRLRARLAAEPPGRLVRVFRDHVLSLDDYLRTRLVELCVHVDDLAESIGVAPPLLPEVATGMAIATLVEVARLRHGDPAVLAALSRRQRDHVGALRVM